MHHLRTAVTFSTVETDFPLFAAIVAYYTLVVLAQVLRHGIVMLNRVTYITD